MIRIRNIFLVVLVAVFGYLNVANAASKCSYEEQVELNNAVSNIKVSYEEAEGIIDPSLLLDSSGGTEEDATYNYFKVQIYNVPESAYIKVTNDVNAEVKYLYYNDSESGVISFDWMELDKVANFEFKVYSSGNSGCPNEEYRIIYLSLPRYNSYSESAKCIGNESYYLCQKYITATEDVDYTTFIEKIEAFESKHKKEEQKVVEENETIIDKIATFIDKNKVVVGIVSTIIVVGGVVAIVIVIKKRRSRLI